MGNPKVKVVITGFEAKHYDELLDIVTLFQYERFMRNLLLTHMDVGPGSRVAEFGIGNGRNARILMPKISPSGEFVGFDISEDMLRRAREKLGGLEGIKILKHDVREKFPEEYRGYFDAALMVLAFHGFTPEDRGRIMDNAREILKPGGSSTLWTTTRWIIPALLSTSKS